MNAKDAFFSWTVLLTQFGTTTTEGRDNFSDTVWNVSVLETLVQEIICFGMWRYMRISCSLFFALHCIPSWHIGKLSPYLLMGVVISGEPCKFVSFMVLLLDLIFLLNCAHLYIHHHNTFTHFLHENVWKEYVNVLMNINDMYGKIVIRSWTMGGMVNCPSPNPT